MVWVVRVYEMGSKSRFRMDGKPIDKMFRSKKRALDYRASLKRYSELYESTKVKVVKAPVEGKVAKAPVKVQNKVQK